jgi:hypothetical protein
LADGLIVYTALHPLARRLDYDPLALDADIAVPAELPVAGQDIYER